jgi:RNA polymerase sigma-70 factor (ECF subfamily)
MERTLHLPPPSDDPRVARAWRDDRRYLLDIAYRMLGSVSEAEDMVQDAFARLLVADIDAIDDVRAWLVTVTTRRCLDQLRSARVRRESYVGPWLPEPIIEAAAIGVDPADRVTLDDSVRMALLVVLERLSPAERAAFVLHDVFQMSFDAVGAIVGRSPAACRQLASRARRRIAEEGGPPRFEIDAAAQQRVTDRFVAACMNGDLEALLDVLDPDVSGWSDAGGFVAGVSRQIVTGRERIGRFLVALCANEAIEMVTMSVNDAPGAVVFERGELRFVIAMTERAGRIHTLFAIGNPEKLAYVASLLPERGAAPE